MNSRITETFSSLRNKNRKALITYITAGDPDLNTTLNLVITLEKAGADIIELGIPYSDPLADGPIIQRASQRALKAGTNINAIFSTVLKIREKTDIPIVFLVYFNSVFRYGIERFLDNCLTHGIDGLVIPDLPLEERKELSEVMKDYPVDLIPLVAPTSEGRIKDIVTGARGFVYCISSRGVTGIRDRFEASLSDFTGKVRKYTPIPLAIGFGISSEETVRNLRELSDGLIVGSAVIQKIEQGIMEGNIEERVLDFISSLRSALD